MAYSRRHYDRSLDPYAPASGRSRAPFAYHFLDSCLHRPINDKLPKLVPARSSWLDGKSKPGPTKRDFDILQSTTASPASRSPGIKPEEAFALAEKALKGHYRTRIACLTRKSSHLAPVARTLPFQVFNELDQEFFRSMLKGNVSLGWSNLPLGVFSHTIRAGGDGNPRIRIELSPELHSFGGRQAILATLVHQMVHAYFLQCCGHRDRGSGGNGYDLGHEQPFRALLKCVGEHLHPLREYLTTDLWVHSQKTHDRLAPDCPCHGSCEDPTPGSSSCYGRKSQYDDVENQDWRNHAIATTESLQDTRKPKSTHLHRTILIRPATLMSPGPFHVSYFTWTRRATKVHLRTLRPWSTYVKSTYSCDLRIAVIESGVAP